MTIGDSIEGRRRLPDGPAPAATGVISHVRHVTLQCKVERPKPASGRPKDEDR